MNRPIMSDTLPPARRVRVLLADDHATVRYGLKLLIDAEPDMIVVGEADEGDEAIRKTLESKPDVVVMDISMPGMNGLAATRTLKKAHPAIRVITLTRHTDDRSEERRVGKECRSRWARHHEKKRRAEGKEGR